MSDSAVEARGKRKRKRWMKTKTLQDGLTPWTRAGSRGIVIQLSEIAGRSTTPRSGFVQHSATCHLVKIWQIGGGRGGIRTPGRVTPTPDFESGAFNHSATLPASYYQLLTTVCFPSFFPLYPVFVSRSF